MSRKLDVAIAEALGYEVGIRDGEIFTPDKNWTEGGCIECGYTGYVGNYDGNEVPYFSESGNAMLELDNEMREQEFELRVDNNGRMYAANYCNLQTEEWVGFVAENTMPLAVAKAAYKALTGKDWQE